MKICSKYKNIETMKITRSGIHETIYHGSYFLLFGERENEVLKFKVYNSSYFEINASLF